MKQVIVFSAVLFYSCQVRAQALLPGYDTAFYPNTLSAAKAVAMPFLLRQGFATMAGVTINDSTLHFGGKDYVVHQTYQNGGTGYTLAASQYSSYGITAPAKVWPYGMPNIMYNPLSSSWDCIGDCVSYVMRVLSATGDTSAQNNAYLNLINTIKAANTTIFASKGYSATAYQLGAAFPTLGAGNVNGWQYISGNVVADSIDATNHAIRPTVGAYNGIAKGGFAAAQAGDVLAFSYPRSSSYNGHLMILESAPQLLNADSLQAYMPSQSAATISALLARFRIYAVPLFDCSGKKAHYRDSRQTVSGIGHGTLLLLSSLSGDIPQGFMFGAGSSSGKLYYDSVGVNVFAISVGRWKGSAVTAVPALQKQPGLTIFPNPVRNVLNVLSDIDGLLSIYDMAGRMVRQTNIGGQEPHLLDITMLPVGTYVINVSSSSGRITKQFSKQ